LSDDELVAAGISGGTIRLSVGLETLDDLIWDLERGLAAASAVVSGNGVAEVPA
jgi:O-acetylhomoserine (thiol)-lyase